MIWFKRILHRRRGALLVLVLLAVNAQADTREERINKSRLIVQEFGVELKARLLDVMTRSGPVAAITVCREYAPALAAEKSHQYGVHVSRTSLGYRNPANAPDAWQREQLARMVDRATAGEPVTSLEQIQSSPDGSIRYMKAIGTEPACLICHGDALSRDVKAAISKYYPTDKATGYRVGDVRGAFSVDWGPLH